jgi:subfamily B ATP-binding cassette protein HlyB/CyaB
LGCTQYNAIATQAQAYYKFLSDKGGQKQRLAIARALLKQPKILIFDEATSALDAETAESFAKTINALKGQVTMLFITHALPKGLKIDEVVHMTHVGAVQLSSDEEAAR